MHKSWVLAVLRRLLQKSPTYTAHLVFQAKIDAISCAEDDPDPNDNIWELGEG